MEQILYHLEPVVRAVERAFIIADMPFGSYQVSVEESVRNASLLIKAGADAVKVEGGGRTIIETINALIEAGIPCQGHLGVTPQYIGMLSGYRGMGKEKVEAKHIYDTAKKIYMNGAFSILLECVAFPLAKRITEDLPIPVISGGSGLYCDGQSLLTNDVLGFNPGHIPRHAKKYIDMWSEGLKAINEYIMEVKKSIFPDLEHSIEMEESELRDLG
jgi:3-methyl-2-oxobutanoate hydroxymethyltransferase